MNILLQLRILLFLLLLSKLITNLWDNWFLIEQLSKVNQEIFQIRNILDRNSVSHHRRQKHLQVVEEGGPISVCY